MPSSESATTAAPLAAIQRSVGIDFIHSISAKPASRAGAKAIPQPSSWLSASRNGRTTAPDSGANSAITLMMARITSASASSSRMARPLMPMPFVRRRRRVEVRRLVLRRVATAPQTSITIGRIMGRRLVRSKKKRASVSRILAFRKPDSAV